MTIHLSFSNTLICRATSLRRSGDRQGALYESSQKSPSIDCFNQSVVDIGGQAGAFRSDRTCCTRGFGSIAPTPAFSDVPPFCWMALTQPRPYVAAPVSALDGPRPGGQARSSRELQGQRCPPRAVLQAVSAASHL